ncbi:MAG TPA: hypothetical protein ENI48_06915, partial [Thioploca sp.]|nr:hypothetical protein [Thioploca sp.]
MQIIVLGMHRSGTSAVARLLNMMGAYFATENNAMPPTAANPKGYWEREDIRQLNDQVITSLGMSWDNISDFEANRLTAELQHSIESQAKKIIFSLETQRPWMAKDPRFCLLLPLWRPLLEIPVCVYVYRSPIQVAQSLKKRDGFPHILGVALWEKYSLYGLAHSAEMPRILVSHEELLNNPVAAVKKLHQELLDCDVQGLRLPSDKEIQAFIEPKLFHQRGDIPLQNTHINRQQLSLVEGFENGSLFQLEPLPKLSDGAAEILQEYKNKLVAKQESIMLQQEIGKRDQELIKCDQEIAQREAEIAKRVEEITGLQNTLEDTKQALQTQKAQTAKYQNQLLVADNQANSLKQEISELGSQKQQLQT